MRCAILVRSRFGESIPKTKHDPVNDANENAKSLLEMKKLVLKMPSK
jgi:hypothetical protein